MPRQRKPTSTDNNPGPFAQILVAARHAAATHKNVAQCGTECGLSRSFLSHIEAGARCPELERVPAIARAYGIPPVELIWTWLLAFAPSTVPVLASYDTVMDTPFLQRHFSSKYTAERLEKEAARLAEKAARKATKAARLVTKAEPQAAATLDPNYGWGEPVGGSLPDGPDFDHSGGRYRPVGERDPTKSPLTPWGGVVDEPGAGKRK